MADRLGEILVQMGALSAKEVAQALALQETQGLRLGEILLAELMVDELTLLRALAKQRHVPIAESRWFDVVEDAAVAALPSVQAAMWKVAPLRLIDRFVVVATSDPDILDRLKDLEKTLGRPVKGVLGRREDVERALSRYYGIDDADGGATIAAMPAFRMDLPEEPPPPLPPPPLPPPPPALVELTPGLKPRTTGVRPLPPLRPAGTPSGVHPTRESSPAPGSPVPARSPKPVPLKVEMPPPLPTAGEEQPPRTRVDPDLAARARGQGWAPDDAGDDAGATLEGQLLPRPQPDPRPAARGKAPANRGARFPQVPTEPVDLSDLPVVRPGRGGPTGERPRPLPPPPVELPSMEGSSPGQAPLSGPTVAMNTPPSLMAAASEAAGTSPAASRDPVDGFNLPRANVPPGPTPFDDGTDHSSPTAPAKQKVNPAAAKNGGPVLPGEGERLGNYTLIKKVKAGGMAEVFLAKTFGVEGFEKQVAIKRILPHLTESTEFVEMFIDEAKLTVQLSHANIAHIHELGKEGLSYFIVMEYINGRDVNALFKDAYRRKQPLPVSICCYVIQQVCEALDYAHRKRDRDGRELFIVHRDVSPANVLVSHEGAVKMIDFGIAKAVSKISMTRPGLIKGKISYMSPEQMKGLPIDRRSDVFAAGIILQELLSGKRLFAAKTDVETIRNVIKGTIPPLQQFRPDIPADLQPIVLRALERDPEKRYAWASELSADLQAFLVRHGMQNARQDLVAHMARYMKNE
jgi:tRNA A-37 threonylcarbamoyl transferase component Bud32